MLSNSSTKLPEPTTERDQKQKIEKVLFSFKSTRIWNNDFYNFFNTLKLELNVPLIQLKYCSLSLIDLNNYLPNQKESKLVTAF